MKHYTITNDSKAKVAFKNHYGDDAKFLNICTCQQINASQAWIITDCFGNKFLQSYNTIVSIYYADTKQVERLGRWSVTTSKHQLLFERMVY